MELGCEGTIYIVYQRGHMTVNKSWAVAKPQGQISKSAGNKDKKSQSSDWLLFTLRSFYEKKIGVITTAAQHHRQQQPQ
jgi:hypothetical protein